MKMFLLTGLTSMSVHRNLMTRLCVCTQDGLKRVSAFYSHTHSLMVCPLTHTQLGNHSQASHVMILEIFERLPPPKKRTLKFQALVLVNPFSKECNASTIAP